MLIFEDDQGICLWPEELVASLTPAYPHRLRVVTHDGLVGYRPDDNFPPGPWQSLQGSLVHPNLLKKRDDHLADPAGFPYPAANLKRTKAWKATGEAACSDGPQKAEDWLQVDRRLYLNPLRVRRLIPEARGVLKVGLEDGRRLKVAPSFRAPLLAQLGLSDARHLQPHNPALFRPFLREYPFELARAPGPLLKKLFHRPEPLIAQLLWQALYYRQTGIEAAYSDTPAGFFCNPVAAALTRAGLWDDSCEALYTGILGQLIGSDRLFTYRELGFHDVYSKRRKIGWARPDIILYIEKDSLARIGKEVAKKLGVSWLLGDPQTPLGAIEYFCAALRRQYQGPVIIIVYGDFVPDRSQAIAAHFERFQTPCSAPPRYLVGPHLFTAQELEWISRPAGIHAEWLQPAERVLEALRTMLQPAVTP